MTAKLQRIRDDVNKRFNYTRDKDERGRAEHWVDMSELEETEGQVRNDDCDGFALMCRFECRKQDIKSRLVYCQTETGGYHLVLESEGWILDNRSTWVKRKSQVDYTWISISGYEKGDPWRIVT